MVAVRDPAAVGVNVMVIVHVCVSAIWTLPAQVPPVRLYSRKLAPVRLKFVMAMGTGPMLVNVTVCVALVVLTDCTPKLTDSGLTVTVDNAPAVYPNPESCTTCGLPAASEAIERVPLRAPVVVGVKVTGSVQLAPAATLAPQAD